MAGNLNRNVISTVVEMTLLVPLLLTAGLELGHYAAKIELIDATELGITTREVTNGKVETGKG